MRTMIGFIFLSALCIAVIGGSIDDCDFARYYDINKLHRSKELQHDFLMRASWWEGKFAQNGVGVNTAIGITYYGVHIDYETGALVREPNDGSDISYATSEGLHLALLALALDEDPYAVNFFRSSIAQRNSNRDDSVRSFIIEQISAKIDSYDKFDSSYPGFAGFLPVFFYVGNETDADMKPLKSWMNVAVSEENGLVVWGLIAVGQVLHEKKYVELAARYQSYVDKLAGHSVMLFADQDGNGFRGLLKQTGMLNAKSQPLPNNYREFDFCLKNCTKDCDDRCILDNPWKADLMVAFMYLYGDWTLQGNINRRTTWQAKRRFLQAVNVAVGSTAVLTIEKGEYYKAEEKRKYLVLPYFDVEINERVFLNGERARMYYADTEGFPGLPYTISNLSYFIYGDNTPLFSVTPVSAFPLLLHPATRSYGIAWYAKMLQGGKMQGPFGTSTKININGSIFKTEYAWYNKIPVVVAYSGGVNNIVKRYLQRTGKFEEFCTLVDEEWSRVFADGLHGEDIGFILPSHTLPDNNQRFPCTERYTPPVENLSAKTSNKKLILTIALSGSTLLLIVLVSVGFYILLQKRKRKISPVDGLTKSVAENDGWNIKREFLSICNKEKVGRGISAQVTTGSFIKNATSFFNKPGYLSCVPACVFMDAAFEACRKFKNSKVALKFPVTTTVLSRKQIIMESQLLMEIGHHENIVAFLGVLNTPERYGIVLELLERDLLAYLDSLSPETFSHINMMRIARDVVSGMIHLVSLNLVHRDLAARNVLLTHALQAKLSDFGLCCQSNKESQYYIAVTNRPLPLKWLSFEAIEHNKFHEKSDVWSFGVLLFEMYSLGEEPYAGVPEKEIRGLLNGGHRLPQPSLADDETFNMMTMCWTMPSRGRPNFAELLSMVERIILPKEQTSA